MHNNLTFTQKWLDVQSCAAPTLDLGSEGCALGLAEERQVDPEFRHKHKVEYEVSNVEISETKSFISNHLLAIKLLNSDSTLTSSRTAISQVDGCS